MVGVETTRFETRVFNHEQKLLHIFFIYEKYALVCTSPTLLWERSIQRHIAFYENIVTLTIAIKTKHYYIFLQYPKGLFESRDYNTSTADKKQDSPW